MAERPAERTILIVEDSELQREFLATQLAEQGFRVLQAESGAAARQHMDSEQVDAVLLDWELPDVKGPQLIREWRADLEHQWVPVLMVTSHEQSERLRQALDAGAMDFVRKPPDEIELFARLRSALRIRELHLMLREQATLDPLTGVRNRRDLMERLKFEFARAKRYGHDLSVVLVDLDYFKQINDVYGHDMGDTLLVQVAGFFVHHLRLCDTVARFGGEEFFLVLPETPLPDARTCLERLQQESMQTHWGQATEAVELTWSAGATSLVSSSADTVYALIKAADLALYEAKHGGRNRIVFK